MSRNARVEELSDTDSDPEEMDIDSLEPPPTTLSRRDHNPILTSNPILSDSLTPAFPQGPQPNSPLPHAPTSRQPTAADREALARTKTWQCLYPVYFDANRTRAQGRRVGKELAVQNPLAQDVVDACGKLGLNVVFEPGKTHPKDWANPGRARVELKEGGNGKGRGFENKHHLYIKVAQYLSTHPTTEASPLRLRIPGMQPATKPLPPPAVPRGWKMGTVLPLHSAGVTGGGVSDNLFKDMMAEMQAQGGSLPPEMAGMANAMGAMGGMGGGGGSGGGALKGAKKEKKKIKG